MNNDQCLVRPSRTHNHVLYFSVHNVPVQLFGPRGSVRMAARSAGFCDLCALSWPQHFPELANGRKSKQPNVGFLLKSYCGPTRIVLQPYSDPTLLLLESCCQNPRKNRQVPRIRNFKNCSEPKRLDVHHRPLLRLTTHSVFHENSANLSTPLTGGARRVRLPGIST